LSKIIATLISLNISLFALDILSQTKEKSLEIDKRLTEETYNKLSKDWLESVIVSFSKTSSEKSLFSASLSQPIFKSGGIFYALGYAKANRDFNKIVNELEKKSLLSTAINSLIGIKKLSLSIEKQNLLIENAKIDVVRKREQTENSILDSSFLNDSILSLNELKIAKTELQMHKQELTESFRNLSDLDYRDVIVKSFTKLSKDEFLKDNLNLKQAKKDVEQKKYLKLAEKARYLPEVAITANYTKQTRENHSTGFAISMPFSLNSLTTIEIAKLNYLKSKLSYSDREREEKNFFEKIAKRVELIENKIAVTSENLELFSSLIKEAKEKFKAGLYIESDVTLLRNSKESKRVDIEIFKLERELELLKLYAKIGKEWI
jgi:outer membrane protein TolC